jgi:hypothetical protein
VSLIFWELLWPCQLACRGASHYRELAGLPTWAYAAVGYGVIAIAVGVRAQRLAEWLSWGAIGASLWFVWLSWELQLQCSHCLAIHTVILCLPAAGLTRLRWDQRVTTVVLSALALHAVFHPKPVTDLDGPPSSHIADETPSATNALVEQLEKGRRMGPADAPWRAELVVDLQCSHCRAVYGNLARAMGPAIGADRVHLTLRLRASPRRPDAVLLARLAIAASLRGDYHAAVGRLLDSPQGLDETTLNARLAMDDLLRSGELAEIVAANQQAIDQVLERDRAWLRQRKLATAPTPQLWITGPDGVVQRLAGDIDAAGLPAFLEANP